jgi:ABC-type Fe3+-siderophore transport system permease subunit
MTNKEAKDTWLALAALFFALASIFTVFGLYRMYNEEHIVGGDADNYIVSASRGTGLICAGIVFALIGTACTMLITALGNVQQQMSIPQDSAPKEEGGEPDSIGHAHGNSNHR